MIIAMSEAEILLKQAVAIQSTNLPNAISLAELALRIAHDEDDSGMEAKASLVVGGLYRQTGEYENAQAFLERALQLYDNDDRGSARVLIQLGQVHLERGHARDARSAFSRAEALLQNSDATTQIAHVQFLLGNVAFEEQDFDEARLAYGRALELYQSLNDQDHLGVVLGSLGRLAQATGRYSEALASYQDAHRILSSLNEHRSAGIIMNYIAECYLEVGSLELARSFAEGALAVAEAQDLTSLKADVLFSIAKLHHTQQDEDAAARALEEAEAIARFLGMTRLLNAIEAHRRESEDSKLNHNG